MEHVIKDGRLHLHEKQNSGEGNPENGLTTIEGLSMVVGGTRVGLNESLSGIEMLDQHMEKLMHTHRLPRSEAFTMAKLKLSRARIISYVLSAALLLVVNIIVVNAYSWLEPWVPLIIALEATAVAFGALGYTILEDKLKNPEWIWVYLPYSAQTVLPPEVRARADEVLSKIAPHGRGCARIRLYVIVPGRIGSQRISRKNIVEHSFAHGYLVARGYHYIGGGMWSAADNLLLAEW
jgi:hypothetical protein